MAQGTVSCPGCGRQYRVRDTSTGGSFRCTHCGETVTYAAAESGPGGGSRRSAARRPAQRTHRRSRPASRSGRGSWEDEEERPGYGQYRGASNSNQALYIAFGVGAVVILVVVLFLALKDHGGTDESGTDASQQITRQPQRAPTPTTVNPNVASSGATASGGANPTKKPGGEENVPNLGGLYGKDAEVLDGMDYSAVVKDLDFLPSTSSDQQDQINELCGKLVDFYAAQDAESARKRLVEIGKPAIPRILSDFLKAGDPTSPEGMSNACFVDRTLHLIAGNAAGTQPLLPLNRPSKQTIQATVKAWYVWWYSEGYKKKKFEPAKDEGD